MDLRQGFCAWEVISLLHVRCLPLFRCTSSDPRHICRGGSCHCRGFFCLEPPYVGRYAAPQLSRLSRFVDIHKRLPVHRIQVRLGSAVSGKHYYQHLAQDLAENLRHFGPAHLGFPTPVIARSIPLPSRITESTESASVLKMAICENGSNNSAGLIKMLGRSLPEGFVFLALVLLFSAGRSYKSCLVSQCVQFLP